MWQSCFGRASKIATTWGHKLVREAPHLVAQLSLIFAKDESECCELGADGDVDRDLDAHSTVGPHRRERLEIGFPGKAFSFAVSNLCTKRNKMFIGGRTYLVTSKHALPLVVLG
jgi:hypothetical protein